MAGRRTTGWMKYASSNVTASATAALDGTSTTPPTNMFEIPDWAVSCRIRPVTVGANKRIKKIAVHLVEYSVDATPESFPGDLVQYSTHELLSVATATSGSLTGVSGGNFATTDNYVGAVGTLTMNAWGTKVLNMVNGSADVYSVDNEIGEILISDCANARGVVIDYTLATAAAATSMNAEIRFDS